jgi:hypothetical protein
MDSSSFSMADPERAKTFTVESVVEMAEKPLFRVTCGDIGAKPEVVEKYLESVLYLGKIWGCVVLPGERMYSSSSKH